MATGTNHSAPFSTKALFWIIFLGILATLGMAVTSAFKGDGKYEVSNGANSFSKSAIGHAAFMDIAERSGWQVLQSQHNTTGKLGPGSTLLLLEPPRGKASSDRIEQLIDWAPMLVVLPKRQGIPHGFKADWIGAAFVKNIAQVKAVAGNLGEDLEVLRPTDASAGTWQHGFDPRAIPDIDSLQLIKSEQVTPLIWNDQGILFGRLNRDYEEEPVWILSDPDLIATHGLARGWNAALALNVLETVSQGRETLVVDEIIHGFKRDPSMARAMFSHPFVYATVAALLAVIIFLLALTRRFGAPWRNVATADDSKAVFIENAARILHMAEKEQEALIRLVDDQSLTVARHLNVPSDLERNRLDSWLDEQSAKRCVKPGFTTIKRRILRVRDDDSTKRSRLLTLANQFYTWKQEIMNDTK
ncbi:MULTISPECIES: DUF4350 domain-containing protein [Kordiimonas]|jgi:hypothetical protein|uniref:DUF4350 domain-containing protein n=1 Tax=Kordiimonas TaxID=288021 RepID=UPI00257C82A0|nr:DUF4350 domain-containing protein [Kordiimonas sp. UBA4487]